MQVDRTDIPGVLLVTPRLWPDARGFFLESFNEKDFFLAGLPMRFVQDNHSRSKEGVLRGLHYQLGTPQGKIVSVIHGKVFDVAADIRRGSPTFGKWVGVVLDDVRRQSLWIPPGFAHGFCALSNDADVLYKCTDYYDPPSERGIRWDDPLLGVRWPIDRPMVSEKDAGYAPLSLERNDLPVYEHGG
ncbi:MAG TPA: dTDP-4-dehydrorhamnose 3,5-epimerase [Gemmatimonadaceae bacterium]